MRSRALSLTLCLWSVVSWHSVHAGCWWIMSRGIGLPGTRRGMLITQAQVKF
jgi:hypothetical protein